MRGLFDLRSQHLQMRLAIYPHLPSTQRVQMTPLGYGYQPAVRIAGYALRRPLLERAIRSTIRCASFLLMDRTHLNGAVAGAGAALSPSHRIIDTISLNHKIAGQLLFGVCIGAVNDFSLALAYANAGCRRSGLEPHARTTPGLRERFIEGRVVSPQLLLVRLGQSRIIVVDQHHVVHLVSVAFLGAFALRPTMSGERGSFRHFKPRRCHRNSGSNVELGHGMTGLKLQGYAAA